MLFDHEIINKTRGPIVDLSAWEKEVYNPIVGEIAKNRKDLIKDIRRLDKLIENLKSNCEKNQVYNFDASNDVDASNESSRMKMTELISCQGASIPLPL